MQILLIKANKIIIFVFFMIKNFKKVYLTSFLAIWIQEFTLKNFFSHMIRKILIDLTCRQFKSS